MTTKGVKKRTNPSKARAIETTIRYVDAVFGEGLGPKHVAFLDRLQNEGLRGIVHHCHAIEANTTYLSLEENYLIGMCVLAALGNRGTAGMFAKVLLCMGTPKAKILEAAGRLSMWMGALPAAEVAFVVQRAVAEFEKSGFASLSAWFPELERPRDEARPKRERARNRQSRSRHGRAVEARSRELP